jgi:hypothetical protein
VTQALQDAHNQLLIREIHTMSVQMQQVKLLQYISQVQLQEQCHDKIIWSWTISGHFTVKSFYMTIKEGSHITYKFSVIWMLHLPTRVTIFQWLLLKKSIINNGQSH